MKHPLGQTTSGALVNVDLVHSSAAQHIAYQPRLLGLITEVLSKATVRGAAVHIECDMGRTVGYDMVVNTSDTDTILYARLLHDAVYTRFVKNGKPLATQYVTIIMTREEDDSYALQDAWVGRLRAARPGSEDETDASKPYWADHAYVLDTQPIQYHTSTKICPY